MATRVIRSATRVRIFNSMLARGISSSVTTTEISPFMTLRKIDKDRNDKRSPLALFMPWLNAPAKIVERYCEIYRDNGFDTLTVAGNAKHFLLPKTAVPFVNETIEYVKSEHHGTPIFVHSFSIGSFLYTVMRMEMLRRAEFRPLLAQIYGQVFDSVTAGGLEKMGRGIAVSVSGNYLVRKAIESAASAYFAATKHVTVRFYDESIDYFVDRPVNAPSLFFHSLADPMCCPDTVNDIVSKWRNEFGLTVVQKCWPDSHHAAHFRKYPQEYRELLEDFIRICSEPLKTAK
ncbi:transmembrane protein 53-B-like [Tubulanus polymorphus]|uniref:transmembrane protein 53-B-like n=1 Tax=Tubulanus polymorphus TaxID=672921 RepID=UPI003DA2C5E7